MWAGGATRLGTVPANAVAGAAARGPRAPCPSAAPLRSAVLADPCAACRPPPQGFIPLHVASASGHAEAVKLLIAARADLAARDVCGLCVALLMWLNCWWRGLVCLRWKFDWKMVV